MTALAANPASPVPSAAHPRPLRWLFVKERFHWPRASGHDVHGSQMMRALAARGHAVWAGTFAPSPPEALAGLGLHGVVDLAAEPASAELRPGTRLQRRFERYWGTDPAKQAALAAVAATGRFDVVAVLGVEWLPLFRGVRGPARVWYAADDAGLLHWTRLRLRDPRTWGELKKAALHALYERAFAGAVDRVWVVSDPDRRAMRLATGGVPVDVVANGVDADHFRPPEPPPEELPDSCVFWGRLDFAPNEDALAWFLGKSWPRVRAALPGARFDVFGFRPSPRVVKLCGAAGVTLTPDLPDLRTEVCRRAVAVLPFVSGGGIKNKLLEAAALARPVACTPRALSGTRGQAPVVSEANPRRLAEAIVALMRDPARRAELGRRARAWVTAEHGWDSAARAAESGVAETLGARRPA